MDLSRTTALIGEKNTAKLAGATVAVAGLGGVGGYAAEALCRSGIGTLILVDFDVISPSNLNRQIIATADNIGKNKTDAAKARFLSVNPDCRIIALNLFITPESLDEIFGQKPDFIIDAVDNVTAKLAMAQRANACGIGFISSMGTGNRIDPTAFRVGDISKTAGCGCPLARVMRREAKKRGISPLLTVYSTELPREPLLRPEAENGSHPPASAGWVVGAAGLALAAEALKYICGGDL